MLVFSRKLNEQFLIGNNVTVTVVEIGANRVRLGIEAPSNVEVDRAEVRQQKRMQRTIVIHRLPRQGTSNRHEGENGQPVRKRA